MRLLLLAMLGAAFLHAAASDVHVTVAHDGSGDFKTIQMAIDHAPAYGPNQRLVVEIKPGRYHERVKIPQERPRLTLLGSDAASTIIEFGIGAREAGGTFFSSVVEVDGAEFRAKNITFQNSYGPGSQAVALSLHSDRAILEQCRFLGWQDTLYAAIGRQFFKGCFIEGQVDFIFGDATAVFADCQIHSNGPGFITAQSRTSPKETTGFVFFNCQMTGENTGNGVFLGRPWRPYARVVLIDCVLGAHIRPEGWDNWNSNAGNEKTAWYAELGSTGPGAGKGSRVAWAQDLTPAQAAPFFPQNFLRGNDNWNPTRITF